MGSTSNSRGSPNPWTPYDSFKECAQGLCNTYCPQWCSYPPPDPDPDSDSATTFSPLVIAVIGILASAFILVSYYAIITKYCRRRRPRRTRSSNIEFQEHEHEDQIWQQQQQVGVGVGEGLDETLINSITVFKFKKGDRLIEGTECSVCLNEFEENENLRLLPKCCHAFHPSCIDVWLKSHTNCPLCRANAVPPPPPPHPASSSSSSVVVVVNTSALQIQPPRPDMIFMLENEGTQRSRHSNGLLDEERQIRRSNSLGTFFSQRSSLLVADILKIEEEEDDDDEEVCGSDTGIIGSSEGNHESNSVRRNPDLFRAPATVRRSFSTGRFYFHKTS